MTTKPKIMLPAQLAKDGWALVFLGTEGAAHGILPRAYILKRALEYQGTYRFPMLYDGNDAYSSVSLKKTGKRKWKS